MTKTEPCAENRCPTCSAVPQDSDEDVVHPDKVHPVHCWGEITSAMSELWPGEPICHQVCTTQKKP